MFFSNTIYNFKSINTDSRLTTQSSDFAIIPSWGFQKTTKNGFSTGLNLGYGYGQSDFGKQKFAFVKISLGWVLKAKK